MATSTCLRPYLGPQSDRPNRPINTTSSTFAGTDESISACCGTYPIRLHTRHADVPKTLTVPRCGTSKPRMILRSVVFPPPLGPTIPRKSSGATSSDTSSSTGAVRPIDGYPNVTSVNFTMGSTVLISATNPPKREPFGPAAMLYSNDSAIASARRSKFASTSAASGSSRSRRAPIAVATARAARPVTCDCTKTTLIPSRRAER